MSDIVDQIDALAADEKCWHCGRAWHELPLTANVARMFESGRLDANYFAHEDTSRIVCEGAGAVSCHCQDRPERYTYGGMVSPLTGSNWSVIIGGKSPAWLQGLLTTTYEWIGQTIIPGFTWPELDLAPLNLSDWFAAEPEPIECEPPPDVQVEFGPQNWLPTEPVYTLPETLVGQVGSRWNQFTKQDVPVPVSPGFDFSHIEKKLNTTTEYPGKKAHR